MSAWVFRRPWSRGLSRLIGAFLSALLGFWAPAAALSQSANAELAKAPTFTPMTARPEILNAPEITRAMQEAYPATLRDAGIGGTVRVFFFIQEDGSVGNALISDGSGHTPLDQAALEVARVYRFKPAMNRDRAVPVWVVFPITFRQSPLDVPRGPAGRAESDGASGAPVATAQRVAARRVDAAPPGDPSRSPRFTPMTVRPEILNPQDVATELIRRYPPLLRDAGVGGTVVVNFFIDVTGRVLNLVVDQSSGYRELDEAALKVASVYRFSPAMNVDALVPVWVTFPITFRVGPR